eukprot:scaffold282124_cov33-Tisochrysis_lutea.AAC.3
MEAMHRGICRPQAAAAQWASGTYTCTDVVEALFSSWRWPHRPQYLKSQELGRIPSERPNHIRHVGHAAAELQASTYPVR